MSELPVDEPGDRGATPARRRPIWFPAALTLMLALFALVVFQRDRIRAHYWAIRLSRSDDLAQRAYYLNGLMALGERAAGAIEVLAEHESPDVRLLALAALKAMPETAANKIAGGLITDPDREVREAAALTLVFCDSSRGLDLLREWARMESEAPAAAAVAALARSPSLHAAESLCGALSGHSSPRVRAQAAESLAEWLGGLDGELDSIASLAAQHDPFRALVEALGDEATFVGLLALERDIAAAEEFVRGRGYAVGGELPSRTQPGAAVPQAAPEAGRTVAQVAAAGLSRLTGETIRPASESRIDDPAAFAEHCRLRIQARARSPAGPP